MSKNKLPIHTKGPVGRRVIGHYMGIPIVAEASLVPIAWELVMPDPQAARDVPGMRAYLDRMLAVMKALDA